MAILSVNAGSSTLKFSIYPTQADHVLPALLIGNFQGLEPGGIPELGYAYQGEQVTLSYEAGNKDPFLFALKQLKELILSLAGLPKIDAVAHRIVHGGSEFTHSVIASNAILNDLSKLNSLAPLHQPHNIEGVRAFSTVFPDVPQVLCFDTAFHQTIPELESSFALPLELTTSGVRRYGFHGLSYQYIIGALMDCTTRAQGRVLMAHLGNGASLCAAFDGKSIATTMGFSALDGLMMGTRAGSIDAGVILYLMEQGYTHDQLVTLLYKKSGLLGVSTISADMRKLRMSKDPLAKKAIDLFTYRVTRESGAMISCLGGLDVIAFSGGIGEHDAQLRADVCKKIAWPGIELDEQLNAISTKDAIGKISSPKSTVEIWVIPTDEGIVAAREALQLLPH
jgi:acetate kinase